jgi:glycosyltransferase involved in cell wall biosynthesis
MIDRREGVIRLLVKMLEWIACRCAHRVLTVSASVVNVMTSCKLCPPDKITVPANGSSNGVDAESRFNPQSVGSSFRTEFRARHNIPEDALVIGFIGRLVKGKGVVELADAWTKIKASHDKVFLVIVGSPEHQDPVPEGALIGLQRDERARMLDFVPNEETPGVYAGLDLVAFPSYSEGLPNVVLEAGAMELPVVAFKVSGCVDAIIDGVTGILAEPKDAESLAAGLQAYLDSEELRREHGKAARRYVLEHFQPEKVWQAVYGEYERLLTDRGLKVGIRNNSAHETITDVVHRPIEN